MEGYGLDELAASAEGVMTGLGSLAAALAGLAVEAVRETELDAMEVLVSERGREILRGVLQLALDGQAGTEAADPLPGEHEKNIRKTTHYLQAKEPCLGYPAALASGWPIATGIIEGACRHIPVN